MRFIVDRLEGSFAICEAEDRSMVDIPLSILPADIKEGTNLLLENGEYEIVASDPNRRMRIQKMMKELWK